MGFLSKIRNKMRKRVSRMPSRGRRSVLTGLRIPNRRTPLEDMITSGRLPQPSIGSIRTPDNFVEPPTMDLDRTIRGPGYPLFDPPRNQPRPIFPRKPIQKGYKSNPGNRKPRGGSSIRDAIRRSEQQKFANPTIFGQPISNFDFGNMPNFSIDDIMEMPQAPTQMPMTQDLPEVAPVGMMPQMRMGGMQDMEPRMMMAGGGLAKGVLTGVKNILGKNQPKPIGGLALQARDLNRIRNAENAIIGGGLLGGAAVTDATQGFTERASMQNMMLNSPEQLGKDLAGMRIGLDRLIDIASQKAQEIGAAPGEYVGRAQRAYEAEMEAERMQQLDAEQGLKNVSLLMAEGGEADSDDFPDLSGDGQITRKDILMGQGVKFKAEGGEMMMEETEMMAPGGDEIEASLMEVQGMQPETQMLDQYVQMVIEMVQAGASEAEVIESLRQAGLDDDDIAAVFQAVMETLQGSMEQGGIDAELAQLS